MQIVLYNGGSYSITTTTTVLLPYSIKNIIYIYKHSLVFSFLWKLSLE